MKLIRIIPAGLFVAITVALFISCNGHGTNQHTNPVPRSLLALPGTTILYTKEVNGKWTPPEIVPFSGGPGVMDFEPALSADGSKFYFLSNRPDGNEPVGDQDIWVVERNAGEWGVPQNLGEPVNTDGGEFFPSVTSDGTLYFTRNEKGSRLNQIFRSRWVDGAFQVPELLPQQVNCGTNRYNAFIAPDESYIIVPAAVMADAYDGVDYYIVFRDENDRWSEPVNMGALVNMDNARGWSPVPMKLKRPTGTMTI